MKQKIYKRYGIEASLLFGLRSKRKLCEAIGIPLPDLRKMCSDENYEEWMNEKGRPIQSPQKKLKEAHSRFAKLLSRIESPEWVFSGKKGVSYIDNSTPHQDSKFSLNVDIHKFYPSSQREFVFKAFRDYFRMSDDVASMLADFLTYKGRIPTGSPASQIVAYWSFKKTFDRIHELSVLNCLKVTLYVDDITFSGDKKISRNFLYKVQCELKKVRHNVNDKTKFKGPKDFKKVTGVAISPKGIKKVPNKLRLSIVSDLKKYSYDGLSSEMAKSLLGKIVAGRQIESNFMEASYKRLIKIVEK